jgi:hypothetical protein
MRKKDKWKCERTISDKKEKINDIRNEDKL